MNQYPYGWPQPQYAAPDPQPAYVPDPTSVVADDQAAGLRMADWALAGGLLATLAIMAHYFSKNTDEHQAIKSYVDDYIMEHSLAHRDLDSRVSALEGHSVVRPPLSAWEQRATTLPMSPYFVPEPATVRLSSGRQPTMFLPMSSDRQPTVYLEPEQPTVYLDTPTLVMSDAPTHVMSMAPTRVASGGRTRVASAGRTRLRSR